MGKLVFYAIICLLGFSQIIIGQSPSFSSGPDSQRIHADIIVIKLKTPSASDGRVVFSPQDQLEQLKELVGYENHKRMFADKSIPNGRISVSNLENIYKLKFKSGTNIWKELSIINRLDFIEYAEPLFQNELLLVPNDPEADPNGGLQDYLTVIRAYDGWQIDQSDSSMVIGIVDTGVNINHEDLGNISYNYDDPINGIDDDMDGYTDNFQGWDIGNDDNDPTADDNPHGTHVTGISSASTNNAIGIAGIGFKSKYLPVNAWNSTSKTLMNEYEGIIYAADHGCKVINLSWGGAGNYSKFGQDVINYAVLEKDVVIVSAAGNTPAELDFYPASFDNVLSVGATDMEDNMASWATYSHFIDIMAPGQKIYSTKNNGTYEKSGGSSFAAPMVAGAAALVRSHFPEFSALQVMEQLRVTSDNIYPVGSNMDYFGQMGKGRLNIYRALHDMLTPSIRLSEYNYTSNHGKLIFPGDTVEINFKFTNYLRTAENVTITISNPSSNLNWEGDQFYIDKLAELESFETTGEPITLIVNQDAEPGERLLFRIDYVGNNYTDFQYFEIKTAPEYFNITDGNLTATITSDGDIGFDDAFYSKGDGILYNQDLIASNSGLIISTDSAHVMDNIINDFENFTRDEDFIAESKARLYDNSVANYDARSVFRPKDTISSALDIKVEQKVLAWENSTNNNYLVFEYRIINTGDSTLTGLSAGLFADWDLGEFQSNEASWDVSDGFGYVFDKSAGELFSGIALLTNQSKTHYAIDIDSLDGNKADIGVVFNDSLKYNFLTQVKDIAGAQGSGNDVGHIVGGTGIIIPSNQSIKVAFAMLASNSLEGLRSALSLAKTNYDNYWDNPPLAETFFACDGDSATVDPEGEIYEFYEDINATVKLDSGYLLKTPPVFSDQEYFLVNLDSGYASDLMKIIVKPGNPSADFALAKDTLLLEEGKSAIMKLENTSSLSSQWQWDFGNGYSSIIENPTANYSSDGLYAIELIASNEYGCSDTTKQDLLVAIRLDRPLVEDHQICKGTKTIISASNTNLIEVYADIDLETFLYRGGAYETFELFGDTIFYVVNVNGDFESAAAKTSVNVIHPEMGFEYDIDTTNVDEKYALMIYNSLGQTEGMEWWIDGSLIGTGNEINYVYDNQPFEITQIKVDSIGCIDTLHLNVTPEYSKIPVLNNIMVCKNEGVTITPQNGSLFYFYKDGALSQLAHKGRSWRIEGISENQKVYVTCVDSLLESGSASIEVTIDPVKALIDVVADTINIVHENTVEMTNKSINAMDSYWISSTGTFDTASIISEIYDQPGTYEYTLIAEGYTGCYDTAYQNIQVISITGLENQLFQNVRIFPNPAFDELTIDLGKNSNQSMEFELIDIFGHRQRKFMFAQGQSIYQFNLQSINKGLYFIRSLNDTIPISFKILIQ